ncbi:MAG TPA: hypothetical protein VL309_03575 [Vicinamibacterales bacterium]|nr:hypothetical protein [Vicinamibacterales bacterium]
MAESFAWVFVVPVVAIAGAFAYAIVNSLARARVRELEIRERIAMIEKGLVPAPEADPHGFDRAMARYDRLNDGLRLRGMVSTSAGRHRRAGVTMMGVGFGLMVLIAFAGGETDVAIGVGGFLVVMGVAFFINSLFEMRQPPPLPANGVHDQPPHPTDAVPR